MPPKAKKQTRKMITRAISKKTGNNGSRSEDPNDANLTRNFILQEENYEVHNITTNDEPKTYNAAIKSGEANKWKEAMQAEISALIKNNTFKLEDLPTGKNVVGCKWVYKVKRNSDGSVERYKARLVAKGSSQKPGEDFTSTFAPVMGLQTLMLLLTLSCNTRRYPKCLRESRFK
jgi:hypothetical protein